MTQYSTSTLATGSTIVPPPGLRHYPMPTQPPPRPPPPNVNPNQHRAYPQFGTTPRRAVAGATLPHAPHHRVTETVTRSTYPTSPQGSIQNRQRTPSAARPRLWAAAGATLISDGADQLVDLTPFGSVNCRLRFAATSTLRGFRIVKMQTRRASRVAARPRRLATFGVPTV